MKHTKPFLSRPSYFSGILLALLFSIFSISANAQLDGTYEVAIKKQEEKKEQRWSLASWLQQKQRNQLMDLWLAKNSHSSPFEFFLETKGVNYGETNGAQGATSVNRTGYSGSLGAYAGVFGLRGGYETDSENRNISYGSLNLRLLGRALQDTHINLEYGLRGTTLNPSSTNENFQNQYGGGSINIYLTKYFGIEGAYHHILPGESNLSRTMQGEDESAGLFIDFSILRIFGDWTNQYLQFSGGGQSTTTEFNPGFAAGLRLYF